MKAVEAVIGSAAGVQPWLQQNSTSGCGVVYKLDATGQQTPLYSFRGGADGANPWAGASATRPATCMGLLAASARRARASYTS